MGVRDGVKDAIPGRCRRNMQFKSRSERARDCLNSGPSYESTGNRGSESTVATLVCSLSSAIKGLELVGYEQIVGPWRLRHDLKACHRVACYGSRPEQMCKCVVCSV
ncbi:hypothetical protein EYC84_005303 [Monilinia fructicola]|uniref:Uncharacterized protein n=1 Tax=Monilinia fructicola TaxID=38448 RepID=A0A5M9JYK0_MONFR|nr:hypothetical protein EYC84_005303 [Monilinia fructicola]